jgi:hypothetical protein
MRRPILLGAALILCAIVANEQVYMESLNLWDACLARNAESSLLLFRDGSLVVVTENLGNRVTLPWTYLFDGKKHRVEDLLLVIHNHLGIGRWSVADRALYHRLRNAGFRGYFLLRLGSGAVIVMKED